MAYWAVEYHHPKKGWTVVSKYSKKIEAEYYIKECEDTIILGDSLKERLFPKFRLKKTKGNLDQKERGEQ